MNALTLSASLPLCKLYQELILFIIMLFVNLRVLENIRKHSHYIILRHPVEANNPSSLPDTILVILKYYLN